MPANVLGTQSNSKPPAALARGVLALLRWPHMPLAAVLASLCLCAPSVSAGFLADDYVHALVLSGSRALPAYAQPWTELFAFATPANTHALMEEGVLPWWSDPQLRVAFFRPLSALTHVLDWQLWPGAAWLMHVHSWLWSVATMLAAYGLYRRVFRLTGEPTHAALLARLALLFYALEPTRAVAVAWIANRNALVSLSLSLAAVCLHLDSLALQPTAAARRVASPLLLGLSVLAGEGGVSGLAFLIAAGWLLDARGRVRGLLALWPHLAAVGCVVALGSVLGFGVDGSDAYLDPRREPIAYLTALPARALALLTASIGGPAADAASVYDMLFPHLGLVMQLVSLLLLVLLGLGLRPLFQRSLSARFFGMALCLTVPPACVAFAADRLLTWLSVAAVALLAECAMVALQTPTTAAPRGLALAASAVLGARVLIAPLILYTQAQNVPRLNAMLAQADSVIPADARVAQHVAVFVNAPEEPLISFVQPQRAALGAPRPRALRRLAAGFSDVAVTRVAHDRVSVLQAGGFLRQHTERLMRSPRSHPFAVGDRVELSDMHAEVEAVLDDGRPLRVAFSIDPALHTFYALRAGGYQPFELPAVGQCVTLETPSFLQFVLGADSAVANYLSARDAPSQLCP
jgi:hypothetical protein